MRLTDDQKQAREFISNKLGFIKTKIENITCMAIKRYDEYNNKTIYLGFYNISFTVNGINYSYYDANSANSQGKGLIID